MLDPPSFFFYLFFPSLTLLFHLFHLPWMSLLSPPPFSNFFVFQQGRVRRIDDTFIVLTHTHTHTGIAFITDGQANWLLSQLGCPCVCMCVHTALFSLRVHGCTSVCPRVSVCPNYIILLNISLKNICMCSEELGSIIQIEGTQHLSHHLSVPLQFECCVCKCVSMSVFFLYGCS